MTEVAPRAQAPYRNLWIILAVLIPATILAFGKSYYDGVTISRQSFTTLIHLHAVVMSLWMLMLIGQAWFIRARQYTLHRWVGRSSFIVAPLVIIMILVTDYESAHRMGPVLTNADAQLFIFDWMQLIGFSLAWILALVYRRRPPIHVRYMVSTVFAMGNAITFRIIMSWFGWVPGLGEENMNNIAAVNGAVLLLILLGLIANDWRLGIRRSPFWLVTATTAILHVGFFTFATSDWWTALVQAFHDLPLPTP